MVSLSLSLLLPLLSLSPPTSPFPVLVCPWSIQLYHFSSMILFKLRFFTYIIMFGNTCYWLFLLKDDYLPLYKKIWHSDLILLHRSPRVGCVELFLNYELKRLEIWNCVVLTWIVKVPRAYSDTYGPCKSILAEAQMLTGWLVRISIRAISHFSAWNTRR